MLASLNATRSWHLNITVTDLQMQKTLEVTGETHVGDVILELVDKMDIAHDWSDHTLWCPERKFWLLKPRVTLNSCGITSDCQLLFTPAHKVLRLQMPDLQYIDMRVNFSIPCLFSIKEVCNDLGIRHPEETSFLRPLETGTKRKERKGKSVKKRPGSSGSDETSTNLSSTGSIENGRLSTSRQQSGGSLEPPSPSSPRSIASQKSSEYSFSGDLLSPYGPRTPMLATSPTTPSQEALDSLCRSKSLAERSIINGGWLDSSKSLMEQDVKEFDLLYMKYKYFNFFDLNPKIDEVRINQIYEQAKWQLLTEEVECTEEEAITFGALQFQVKVASTSPTSGQASEEVDDIEAALNDLQMTLEGTTAAPDGPVRPTLTHIPELSDTLNLVKTKKLGLKSVKPYWFVFKDTHISYYKSKNESFGAPIQKVNLKGCEVTPEVNIAKDKFNIKLKIPGPDMLEIELSCASGTQYAKWMAACRLASKGKTMADPTYDMEVSGVRTFLNMQKDKDEGDSSLPEQTAIQAEDFVPPRLLAKYKSKQIAARILEAHSAFTKLTLLEAKMNFIRQWQALPEFGITTFNVKFKGAKHKKAEALGISFNRVVRMEPVSREVIKEWRYSAMKSWNVNWETKEMIVQCEDEVVIFSCVNMDVKVVHEFIGGYIYLSMRKDVNSPLDEELFFKLTGGWS